MAEMTPADWQRQMYYMSLMNSAQQPQTGPSGAGNFLSNLVRPIGAAVMRQQSAGFGDTPAAGVPQATPQPVAPVWVGPTAPASAVAPAPRPVSFVPPVAPSGPAPPPANWPPSPIAPQGPPPAPSIMASQGQAAGYNPGAQGAGTTPYAPPPAFMAPNLTAYPRFPTAAGMPDITGPGMNNATPSSVAARRAAQMRNWMSGQNFNGLTTGPFWPG